MRPHFAAAGLKRSLSAIAAAALMMLGPAAVAEMPGAPATPGMIKTVTHGHGWTFTTAEGMALYTFANDLKKPGGSVCNGPCAEQWPPLLADENAEPIGPWEFATRDDGARQWALNGMPVYLYADEPGPGFTFGEGHNKVWSVAEVLIPTPPQMSITRTVLGRTLATHDGHTLYTNSADAVCDDACAMRWTPLYAAATQKAWDDWSVRDRKDGTFQWEYRGQPLFTYAGDVGAREVSGDGRQGTWQAVVLEPRAPTPDWVMPVGTDAGVMLGNAEGMAIYYYVKPRGREDCVAFRRDCIIPDWEPVLAEEGATPVGDWTILEQPDGSRQWGFRGHRVYTYKHDITPGDFKGIAYGSNRGLKVIMLDGDPLQGVGGAGG